MDPLKVGIYVVLALPGFIFIQVHEHHLLREKKPQFEKTLEIILASALIWLLALSLPIWWPWADSRQWVLRETTSVLSGKAPFGAIGQDAQLIQLFGEFFFGVCLWTWVAANLWGVLRKSSRVDALIKYFTGRDWYPSVSLRFFETHVNQAVIVTTKTKRYPAKSSRRKARELRDKTTG